MRPSFAFALVASLGFLVACSSETAAPFAGPAQASGDGGAGGAGQGGSTSHGTGGGGVDAAARPPLQTGIYVSVIVSNATKPFNDPKGTIGQILSRSYVHGLSLQFGWRDLEVSQGKYESVVKDAIDGVRALSQDMGKPITVKVHLRNGLVPDWLVPDGAGAGAGDAPFAFDVNATPGFRALGQKDPAHPKKLDLTLIPTEPGYVAHVKANVAEVANQLDLADPNGDLVRIVEVAGPSSESGGTMRLSPRLGFPIDGKQDIYGFGWTFAGHLQAWKDMGPFMASLPAYRKRQWTFDLTHEAPDPKFPADQYFALDTAAQMSVANALVAAHPQGKSGIRLMNEGASAQSNPTEPKKCSWAADNFDHPNELPDATIAAWPDHEWQIQALADDASNFPRFELARCTLFGDPKDAAPTLIQHTSFVEIHDDQALNDAMPLGDQTDAVMWFTCFDAMIRKYANSGSFTAPDKAFWATMPSLSSQACGGTYTTPPAGVCAP